MQIHRFILNHLAEHCLDYILKTQSNKRRNLLTSKLKTMITLATLIIEIIISSI